MGKFAKAVQNYLRDSLAERYSSGDWATEYRISGTPVDIGGRIDTHLAVIELEWRRADPADNTAKIFRHLSTDDIEAEQVTVFQIFTDYYELSRGGVSSKRKNAEFVGKVADQTFDRLSYFPVDFDIDPPKQGEEWPDTWKAAADKTVTILTDELERKEMF